MKTCRLVRFEFFLMSIMVLVLMLPTLLMTASAQEIEETEKLNNGRTETEISARRSVPTSVLRVSALQLEAELQNDFDGGVARQNSPVMMPSLNRVSDPAQQSWDVGADDTSFFVRDLENGSSIPFRIMPGAPTGSIGIDENGNVGIGTLEATARLHVVGEAPTIKVERSEDAGITLHLDARGNLTINGLLTESSDASLKENFKTIDGDAVLDRLATLPVTTWNYLDATDRHLGPTAQDFYSAFGLGKDNRHIAPLDVNGVALTSIQALNRRLQEKEARVEELEQQNEALTKRLDDLESLVRELVIQEETPTTNE